MRYPLIVALLLAFGCGTSGTHGDIYIKSGTFTCSSEEYGLSHTFRTKVSTSSILIGFGGEPSTFKFVDLDTGRAVKLVIKPGSDWTCVQVGH